MPFGFWGAATEIYLQLPEGIVSFALLALLAGLNLVLLARYHKSFARMNGRQWVLLFALGAAGLLCSQLFPIDIPLRNPVLAAQPPLAAMSLLSAVPLLLAATIFNPGAALVMGLATGLGHGLGQTHSLFDIVNFGLAGWLAGVLLGQNYAGRLFGALRWPVVTGPIAMSLVALLMAGEIFGRLLAPAGVFAALDMALYVGSYSLLPLLAEGFVGGGLVSILLYFLPQIRGSRGRVPSPFGRSLQNYMTASFFWFTVLLVLLSVGTVFALSTRTMSRALVEQMAFSADATSTRVQATQGELTNVLVQYSGDDRLLDPDWSERDKALVQLGRSSPQFEEVLLVSADGQVGNGSGLLQEATVSLNAFEQAGVSAALSTGRAQVVGGQGADSPVFTLITPVGSDGQQGSALLGRVSQSGLVELMSGLSSVLSLGSGLLVDATSNVVLSGGVNAAPMTWQAPERDRPLLPVPASSRGFAYETISEPTGGRELIYYTPVPGSSWTVVAVVPHSVILRQALQVIAPVALLLLLVSILFFVNVSAFGRSVSRPIGELVDASRAIAGGGGLEKTVRVERDDELGQLSAAFGQMQRSLKQRLDELNLLLTVSNEVASSINLSQGMPAVLQGVLRGTGASAARAVVRNPSASYPLIFAEGPAAAALAPLDRPLMTQIRAVDEIALSSPEEISAALNSNIKGLSAVFAVPLRTATEFQGVLYLGYRQNHYFDNTERNLLHTLAGQATVLVHNAHLFTSAESGRQRLAAILASTTNAVIVTDQTDRILLTNPAMERAFGLRTQEIAGRPVQDIIRPQALTDRLSLRSSLGETATPSGDVGSVEVQVNGRTFVANIATVHSGAGQALGRVAVLHDVTDFKDLDRMKSDFLAGVSHDLLSPLTYMQNYASMLPMEDDFRLQKEYVDKILGGIQRMTHMINDLLELARIEAAVDLQVQPIPLGQLLLDVGQEHWSHAREVGVTIKSHVTGTPVAQGDPVLLRRAVNNLVTNAIKYAPHSGELLLHGAFFNNEYIISVHDHGPGIPADELPHLFNSFYRGKQHLHDSTRGSGLGLAIVKSIVELHGGRVFCECPPDQGTRFIIRLPADARLVKKQPATFG